MFFSAPVLKTIGLLLLSNVFMTFAWYGHLKNLSSRPWFVAAIASWGIALFEYLLQVPKPDRTYRPFARPAQDSAGGDCAEHIRSLLAFLHEGAALLELPLGRALYRRSGLFHIPWIRT